MEEAFGEGMGKSAAGIQQKYHNYNISLSSSPTNYFSFSWRLKVLNSMLVWDGIQKVAEDGELRDVKTWQGAFAECIGHFTEELLRWCIYQCLSGPNFDAGTRKIRATMQYCCIFFFPGP